MDKPTVTTEPAVASTLSLSLGYSSNTLGMLNKDLTRFMSLSRVRSIRARERKDLLAGFEAGNDKLFLTIKSSPKASSICFTPNVSRKESIGDAATTASITTVASKTR